MPSIFIDATLVHLPQRYPAGATLCEHTSALLTGIWVKRLTTRLRYALSRGEVQVENLQAKANLLAAEPLAAFAIADQDDEDDPIFIEALTIAREFITSRMAGEALPEAKKLDIHAKALVEAIPEIMDRARFRVEARYRAAAEVLGNL